MSVIESISMWGGFAGVIIAIIAVVILILTRNNIIDILDKDAILFEQNFEMRKSAIENIINLADYLLDYGVEVISNKAYKTKCKTAYNEIICLIHNAKLIDNFYDLCLNDSRVSVSAEEISAFKNLCRKELGYKHTPSSYIGAMRDIKINNAKGKSKKSVPVESDENI